MMRYALAVVFAGVLLLGVHAKVEEKKPVDKNAPVNLIGDYVIVSGERDGQKEPDETIVGALLHITEDRILMEDRDHKSTPFIATYTLDTSKKPLVITMTSMLPPMKGDTLRGLIEKEGDQVRLIYALPGGEMPAEFKTKEKQVLVVTKLATK
jgi:uncharacterized protein (TIGR03067 family)